MRKVRDELARELADKLHDIHVVTRGLDRLLVAAAAQGLFAPHDPMPELTLRERQVLALLTHGATNPEIARSLGLAASTVKDYTKSLYAKLGARNRADAAARARRMGIA